eukprot:1148672-Pelagomonas_calceolata.AAC.3
MCAFVLPGGAGGRIADKESRAGQTGAETHDTITHATTQISARDPLASEPRPIPDRISPSQHQPQRLIRGQGGDRAKGPPAVTPSQPSSRALKKQGSIGGEPYSNPLFAHGELDALASQSSPRLAVYSRERQGKSGKIRYHMILPEAVPSHLFYSRPEVEALTSGNGTNRYAVYLHIIMVILFAYDWIINAADKDKQGKGKNEAMPVSLSACPSHRACKLSEDEASTM